MTDAKDPQRRIREYHERAEQNWTHYENGDGTISYEAAQMILLMDIRGQLRKLNNLLHCANFTAIPSTLRAIAAHTKRRKPKRGARVRAKRGNQK